MKTLIVPLKGDSDTHMVITYRETRWPFYKGWMCCCGHIFKATYMGPALVKEFREHAEVEE